MDNYLEEIQRLFSAAKRSARWAAVWKRAAKENRQEADAGWAKYADNIGEVALARAEAAVEVKRSARWAAMWKRAAKRSWRGWRNSSEAYLGASQDACGFALGAGMEIGAAEREADRAFDDYQDLGRTLFAENEVLFEQSNRYRTRALEARYIDIDLLRGQRDAALARAEAAEADAHQQRVERDAMFDTAESALARAERLEKALREAHALTCYRTGSDPYPACQALEAALPGLHAAALREGKP